MKGIIADCKSRRIDVIDDGLPEAETAPWKEPEQLNIPQVNQAIRKISDMAPGSITAAPGAGAFASSKSAKPGILTRIKSVFTG
jgi:hypothetical protein